MRKILLLGLLVVLIASCSKKTNVEITGAIKEAANTKVYLEQIDVSSRKTIDSTKINKNGEFKFKLNIELPTFYSLRFSNNEQVTLIASPCRRHFAPAAAHPRRLPPRTKARARAGFCARRAAHRACTPRADSSPQASAASPRAQNPAAPTARSRARRSARPRERG